jgi:hypothetical protein
MLVAAHYALDFALNVLDLFGEWHVLFEWEVEIGLHFPKIAGVKLRWVAQDDCDCRFYRF